MAANDRTRGGGVRPAAARLARLLRPEAPRIAGSALLAAFDVGATLSIPFLARRAMDGVLLGPAQGRGALAAALCGAMCLLAAVRAAAGFFVKEPRLLAPFAVRTPVGGIGDPHAVAVRVHTAPQHYEPAGACLIQEGTVGDPRRRPLGIPRPEQQDRLADKAGQIRAELRRHHIAHAVRV